MSDETNSVELMMSFMKKELDATHARNEERRAREDMTFARVRIAAELLRRGGDPSMCVAMAKELADDLLRP